MLKLKDNCTAIKFNNLVLDDGTISTLLYGAPSSEKAITEISHLEECCNYSPEYEEDFRLKINDLERLLADKNYQNGLYPRGLEKIIQQIIEPMSLWEAITGLDTEHFLASKNYFCNLMDVGITFLLSCEMSKLFNSEAADFSLYNVWHASKNRILIDGTATQSEVAYIDKQFEVNGSHRNPSIKRLLNFRNKQVAHNSASDQTTKDDFVFTVKFILRVWAIIDETYSPNCMPRPIHLDEHLFDQFHKIMSMHELKRVKKSRLEFIKDLLNACSLNMVTGINDNKRPFGELKVTVKII